MPQEASPTPPRRILALAGGGVRGIVEVAFLEAVEAAYRARFGPQTRLCDVFHLIGGTSTGALIATALALGLPLETVRDFYLRRADAYFRRRRWWAWGQTPIFDGAALEAEIRETIGDVSLGDEAFQSYLAIVAKRLDTGSAWIINNIPHAPYFEDAPDGSYIGNRHFDVAELLRAATAAPVFFDQQPVEIGPGQTATFVDGGLSPYNDPSLALLKLARLRAFGLNWPTGPEQLFVLSIGTGRYRQRVPASVAARAGPLRLAYLSMRGMATDGEVHTLTIMQGLGRSLMPVEVNSEIGTMAGDTLAGAPLFDYLRLDLPLERAALSAAGFPLASREIRRFHRFDDPDIIRPLYDLTRDYIAATLDLGAVLFGTDGGGGRN